MKQNTAIRLAIAILTVLLCVPAAVCADYYVSPNGSPRGDGSRERPWDLASVLRGTTVSPGSTVWVMGGTYRGAFTSYLRGTSSAPITLRVVPGERAILNGEGYRGERQNSVFAVFGEWTNYIGLEVTSNARDRSHPSGNDFRQSGIDIFGPHVKVINFVVHDTGEGNGFWVEAEDSELYGNIIFNCGSQDTPTDNRHGHGIYTQNKEGTKIIRDNLLFNNYGFGIHAWGKPKGIRGYQIDGNIIFNNGTVSGGGMRLANILITGGPDIIADRISLTNNATFETLDYQPARDLFHDANVCLVCDNGSLHGSATVTGNYFAGGAPVLVMGKWSNLDFSGNTLVGNNGMIVTDQIRNGGAWNNNRYYGRGFKGDQSAVFGYAGKTAGFRDWQARARTDSAAVYSADLPHNAVFVRPNQYEPGRAYIAVYNWEHLNSVDVDLSSALRRGARFEVRNAQDFFGAPVLSGTYDGGSIRLPMTGLRIQPPEGSRQGVVSTLPDFNAFVVVPQGSIGMAISAQEAGSVAAVPPRIGTQAADLSQFAGSYISILPPGRIDVVFENGELRAVMMSEKNHPSYLLAPVSDLKFRVQGAPSEAYLEFQRSGDRIAGMRVLAGSRPMYNMKKR